MMANKIILQDINHNGIDMDKAKYHVFPASQDVKPCVGCFGCWVKTPGKCVIKDKDSEFAAIMPHAKEIIVISQLVFGGLSPHIKAILDRSIGFILPFFEDVNGEMHHKQRYASRPALRYMLYGDSISQAEKTTANKLIRANAVNFGISDYRIDFYDSYQEILEELR